MYVRVGEVEQPNLQILEMPEKKSIEKPFGSDLKESAKFRDEEKSAERYTITKLCKTGFGKTTVSGEGSTVKSVHVPVFSFTRNIEKLMGQDSKTFHLEWKGYKRALPNSSTGLVAVTQCFRKGPGTES